MLGGLLQELDEGPGGLGGHEIRQGKALDAPIHRLLGHGPGGLGTVPGQDIGDPVGLELDQQLLHDDVHEVVVVEAHGNALDEVH